MDKEQLRTHDRAIRPRDDTAEHHCPFDVDQGFAKFPALRARDLAGCSYLFERMNNTSAKRPDLTGRADIERLVNAFYDTIRGDEMLGFIFNDVAKTDWAAHLPKMYAFWETMIFRAGTYVGNPLAAHARLVPLTTMGRPQFDRWLAIFTATVDGLFAGEKAEHIKSAAADMANVIHAKINGVEQERYDYSQLTPEQRARYASYKPKVVTH